MQLFASVCLHRAGAQKSYFELLEDKEWMEKFEIYCLGTLGELHLGQKESLLCASNVKGGQKFGGIQKYSLVSISLIITNIYI